MVAKQLISDVSLGVNLQFKKSNPVSLVHFITNRCNARCSFCFIDFDNPETFANELTTDEIDRLTKNLGPNLQNVNITGGEPFARKDLNDIINSYYTNTNIRSVFMTSNGSLPDRLEKLCAFKKANHPKRKLFLQISIDALPKEHDRIRKIDGLFDKALQSYHIAKANGPFVQASVAMTISHENHEQCEEIYYHLTRKENVTNITLNIVRDEGVYKIPTPHKQAILDSYIKLTEIIENDKKQGLIEGWDNKSIQGKLMNKKNQIWREVLADIYMEPDYKVPCMAGSIFGIIEANGEVRPCEILDKPLGNVRDFDLNFMSLWQSQKAKETKDWIKDTKCNCHYDCAWSFNILANKKYQFDLFSSLLKL